VAEVGRLARQPDERLDVIRVRKEWTLKQALTADKRYTPREGKRSDPHRPSAQWRAMHELDALEVRFQGGEQYALAMALRDCANHALPMPPWVAAAYIKGFDLVHTYRADTWDVLFGAPIPKGKQQRKLREQFELAGAVWHEVQRRHDAGEAIDEELFEDVGKTLGIGKTVAKDYYALDKAEVEARLAQWGQPGDPIGEVLKRYRKKK
jgi:hypothetical protein